MLSGGCLLFLLFHYSLFGIWVFRTAEGIQQYEYDDEYEHIRQSSALSVVGELSNIHHSNFPSILLLPLLYTRAAFSFSSLLAATPCPYSASKEYLIRTPHATTAGVHPFVGIENIYPKKMANVICCEMPRFPLASMRHQLLHQASCRCCAAMQGAFCHGAGF